MLKRLWNQLKDGSDGLRQSTSLKVRMLRGGISLTLGGGIEQASRVVRNILLVRLLAPEVFGLFVGGGSGNSAYNNLFINNSSIRFSNVTHDYNAFSGADDYTESNAQVGLSASIFYDYANNDYHLVQPTALGYVLARAYEQDIEGIVRGADGNWDMGAFEYFGEYYGDGEPPLPPENLRIVLK